MIYASAPLGGANAYMFYRCFLSFLFFPSAVRHNDSRGVATRVDIGIYTPKISPSKLLWGKNDVRKAIQQFYTPKKLLNPQIKFLATPLNDSA